MVAGGTGGAGGAGGGFVAILADGGIRVPGIVLAKGSGGLTGSNGSGPGGSGSGGKFLLRSLAGVSVTGTVHAGSTGFARIDGYGSRPALSGNVQPTPVALNLPDLDKTTDSKIGTTMTLRVVALPDDTILLAVAVKGANIPLPPLGTLKLDPGTMLVYGTKKATSGLDGIATFDVPIPNNSKILGVMVHWQALNTITVSNRPLLTNNLITTLK